MSFFPTPNDVIDSIAPNFVEGYIYGALVEAFASENHQRMMAMEAATDSAKDILHDLSIEYNRARQAAITQEITEIVGGAKAQQSKRKK
jgi:F-type H+-transporting ATPase subunit gamma